MQIIDNIPVWGTQVDEGALKQIRTCYWIFGQAAMMADHHKGYGVPIGGVIAHEFPTCRGIAGPCNRPRVPWSWENCRKPRESLCWRPGGMA